MSDNLESFADVIKYVSIPRGEQDSFTDTEAGEIAYYWSKHLFHIALICLGERN